jgi:hypothetical protein
MSPLCCGGGSGRAKRTPARSEGRLVPAAVGPAGGCTGPLAKLLICDKAPCQVSDVHVVAQGRIAQKSERLVARAAAAGRQDAQGEVHH